MKNQDTTIDSRIGQRVQLIREHMKLDGKKVSRNTFGEWFNKSPKTVQSWETGTRKVPDYVIETLAKKLDIDEDFIRCKYDTPLLTSSVEKWDAEFSTNAIQDLNLIDHIEFLLNHSINDQLNQDEVRNYLQEIDDFIIFKYEQITKRKEDHND